MTAVVTDMLGKNYSACALYPATLKHDGASSLTIRLALAAIEC
jgi:hypothetical protein